MTYDEMLAAVEQYESSQVSIMAAIILQYKIKTILPSVTAWARLGPVAKLVDMAGSVYEIEHLRVACHELYQSPDPARRNVADKMLFEFALSNDCFEKCIMLMESDECCRFVAVATLLNLLGRNGSLTNEQRLKLRTYLLNFMFSHKDLESVVIPSFCTVLILCFQLISRIIRISWFDEDANGELVFQTAVKEIMKIAEELSDMCPKAIQLLSNLVVEMCERTGVTLMRKRRKTMFSFRDTFLFDIYKLSITLLRRVLINIPTGSPIDVNQEGLLKNLLQLSMNCLNYDFNNSSGEEASDDNLIIAIPDSWRSTFIQLEVVPLYKTMLVRFPQFGSTIIACLTQLACLRRAFLMSPERTQFLQHIIDVIRHVLSSSQIFSDQEFYHEVCLLICRLKSCHQLNEIVKSENYGDFISKVTQFTINSLRMVNIRQNSIYYLLMFWKRVVDSISYVRMGERSEIENYAPVIAEAYLESRMLIVDAVANSTIEEDPLDSVITVIDHVEQLSKICRYQYRKSYAVIIRLFDEQASAYNIAVSQNLSIGIQATILENKLTWLIYIIGGLLTERSGGTTLDEVEQIEADLICRVLQLMRLTDAVLAQRRGSARLESSYLWFLECFRKVYVSDTSRRMSKVFQKLSNVLGVTDETALLTILVRKAIQNLKNFTGNQTLLSDSMKLIDNLSDGYSAAKIVSTLQDVNFLMNNHTAQHFPLLGLDVDIKTMKLRTQFYFTLSRLVNLTCGENVEEEFNRLLAPFKDVIAGLEEIFKVSDSSALQEERSKRSVIGLGRDLRGILLACSSNLAFTRFWSTDHDLVSPIFRFCIELCDNRSARMNFKVSCPYVENILNIQDILEQHVYEMRLKGFLLCFRMLRKLFVGQYLNFGCRCAVSKVCSNGHLHFTNKFVCTCILIVVVQFCNEFDNDACIQEYPKLAEAFYMVELQIFLLRRLLDGIGSFDTNVATCCCSSLDNFVDYLHQRLRRVQQQIGWTTTQTTLPAENDNCLKLVRQHPDVIQEVWKFYYIMVSILNKVLFDDSRCQWSLSRPLLGLILLQEQFFNQWKVQTISSFPLEEQIYGKCKCIPGEHVGKCEITPSGNKQRGVQ
ncbi:putative Ran-binding protein 17 [Trichinella spiralis]|uniref:putative Ran-binding protein 17 n=1 Tax=Trichinella spiralis TaxID=6334 RepID=UPI0001EFC94B|nr:putative Ran-binding protein 17 [Trichinella spiralis]